MIALMNQKAICLKLRSVNAQYPIVTKNVENQIVHQNANVQNFPVREMKTFRDQDLVMDLAQVTMNVANLDVSQLSKSLSLPLLLLKNSKSLNVITVTVDGPSGVDGPIVLAARLQNVFQFE